MIDDLEPDGEWAETVSSRIWSSPIVDNSESFKMDVDWRHRGVLQGYLEELWSGIKALRRRIHAYAKVKST
jgi:hypothetical protein